MGSFCSTPQFSQSMSIFAQEKADVPTSKPIDRGLRGKMEAELHGIELCFFGEERYVEWRKTTNEHGLHSNWPASIARPATVADVSKLVQFAVKSSMALSVKNGGHSMIWGKGSLCIDMKRFDSVAVDLASMTVTVGGGVHSGQIDSQVPDGICTICGNYPTVGYAAQVMGGGIGYKSRTAGLAVDSLLAMTLVLGDGSVVEANAEGEHSELFWALRGGGANFGIVVAFTVKAHKVGWDDGAGPGRLLWGQRITMCEPAGVDRVPIVKNWVAYALNAPPEVTCDSFFLAGGPWIQLYSYMGAIAAGREQEKIWKTFVEPGQTPGAPPVISDDIGVGSYKDLQNLLVPVFEPDLPLPVKWFVCCAGAMPEAAIDIICHFTGPGAPNQGGEHGWSLIHVERMGGAIANPPNGKQGAAFAQRDALFWVAVFGTLGKQGRKDPENVLKVEKWLKDLEAALRPLIVTKDAGSISMVDDPAGLWLDKHERLRATKQKYDARNVFFNVQTGFSGAHNIKP